MTELFSQLCLKVPEVYWVLSWGSKGTRGNIRDEGFVSFKTSQPCLHSFLSSLKRITHVVTGTVNFMSKVKVDENKSISPVSCVIRTRDLDHWVLRKVLLCIFPALEKPLLSHVAQFLEWILHPQQMTYNVYLPEIKQPSSATLFCFILIWKRKALVCPTFSFSFFFSGCLLYFWQVHKCP